MKIDQTNLNASIGPVSSVCANQEAGGQDFARVLNQALGQTSSQTSGASAVAAMDNTCTLINHQGETLEQVSQLLDALDEYGQVLGNPEATLRQVEPLAKRVESLASELEQNLDETPAGELSLLVRQTLAQAQAETIKFNRGDYL